MFILLDEIPQNSDQVKYATLIQIIKQKKKGNVRFVKLESDISEQLNGWKQFLDDSDPNGLMWYARLDHDINKIQSSGSSYVEHLSSLVQKTELEFLDHFKALDHFLLLFLFDPRCYSRKYSVRASLFLSFRYS